jgi:hypothetical protein
MHFFLSIALSISLYFGIDWGFFAHRSINQTAIYTLPPELVIFYKSHMQYIRNEAVSPDKRKFTSTGEAPRHYIDLDYYDSLPPKNWFKAKELYSEDTLIVRGILPWHLMLVKVQLTKAMEAKDLKQILRLSADAGHYIGDAHVPLHTVSNYNGQKTNQHGIHGLWESRLPELFHKEYKLFTGTAIYIPNMENKIWDIVLHSNSLADSVLRIERELSLQFSQDQKYSFEDRNGKTIKVYSKEFSYAYQIALNNMVEKQMKQSILMTGSFWYTCWVDAGKPDLSHLKASFKSKKKADIVLSEQDCQH